MRRTGKRFVLKFDICMRIAMAMLFCNKVFVLQVIAIGREHEAIIPNFGLHPWCADAPAVIF